MTSQTDTRLSALGIIRIDGSDAERFLRNQLTNDVFRLGPDRHFLAAWCDAKGRTQMIVQVVATTDCWYLLLPREILDGVIKRLKMYVLRDDVRVTDESDTLAAIGHINAPTAPEVNTTITDDHSLHIGLADTIDGHRRSITIVERATADSGPTGATTNWDLAMIDAGVPQIVAATQGAFVPQMLNLHWLMAIDFAKGCYPGQEVVARLHYRGRLTRRVFRLSCPGTPPAPGSDILDTEGSRCGTVLQAARDGDDTSRLLAVVAVDRAERVVKLDDHRELSFLDLPYATPA
tara:strand:+ start:5613 stop:6485 length:873 start_codon:yes stop_codon:yes gene_type:complete